MIRNDFTHENKMKKWLVPINMFNLEIITIKSEATIAKIPSKAK